MRIRRKVRLNSRATNARVQRRSNAIRKQKEQTRRDRRMTAFLKDDRVPHTPDVMSWLSRKLDKPFNRITAEDVAALTK